MPKPLALALAATALLAPVAAAQADTATPTAVPAACAGKAPVLQEGERLVEHTLFLHGTTAVGNVDQVQDFAGFTLSSKKSMTPTAPTGSEAKTDLLVPGTNANFAGNPNMAYWLGTAESELEQTIVCAEATYFGSAQGTMRARLFADAAWAGTTPSATATVAGAATLSPTATKYTVNFGKLAVPVTSNVLFQLEPTNAAYVRYDATTAPSSFTYVTVERPFSQE